MGRLDEIEARVKAATPGPWSRPMEAPFDGVMVISQAADKNVAGVVWPDADATFIAHSREDVEWLVERVRELEGRVPPFRGGEIVTTRFGTTICAERLAFDSLGWWVEGRAMDDERWCKFLVEEDGVVAKGEAGL